MKLIKHIIFADIGDGEKIMINSLNGTMDKIDDRTFKTIERWQKCDEIVSNGEYEIDLHKNLMSRGYLVNDRSEELVKKEEILKQLRLNHAKIKANDKHITFIMTYDCNFRCSYCFEGVAGVCDKMSLKSSDSHSRTAVITSEQIDAAFKLVGNELQSIGLFGGEPLLPKNKTALEYIIAKAPDKTYSVITNGYYLEEYFDLLSRVSISSIMVTLDGEEDIHNSRRFLAGGKPTYQKIMNGVEKCLKGNIPICIRMNLDGSNFDDGSRLKAKLLEQFTHYGDLLSFEMSPMLEAPISEKNKIFSELHKSDISFTPEERMQRNRLLSKFSPIINHFTTGAQMKPVYSFCSAHDSGYLVDPYGHIFPCILAVGKEELSIGAYYPKVEFNENSIRNRNIDKIPQCKECIYSLLCGGGCAVALPDYTDVFKPVCFNIKNQIHNILPMFYNAMLDASTGGTK